MRVEVEGLTKAYGALRVLDDVSFALEPGKLVAVLGPNGAGKTTLLRCLAGVAVPDAGGVRYDGEPFDRERLDLRRRLAFLPDLAPLPEGATVVSYLGLVLRLYEAERPGLEERVIELLRAFDMLPLVELPVATLSRGQAYKAGLIPLLAVEPPVLLLDEPFASGMDAVSLQALKREVGAATAAGRTVIYTTQILELVERFADEVLVIHRGALRGRGPLPEVLAGAATDLTELFERLRDEA